MKTEIYLKTDIARILDLPSRTVDFWINKGLVLADISNVPGKGRTKEFSHENLVEFAMVAVLAKDEGVALYRIWFLMEGLRKGSFGMIRSDFFRDAALGVSREIIVMVDTQNKFDIMEIEVSDDRSVPRPIFNKLFLNPDRLCMQSFFLGKIRNRAVDLLKI
jgi:DNA-binding transcriptional MerR regulator